MRADEDCQAAVSSVAFDKSGPVDLHARPDETLCVSHTPHASFHLDHRQLTSQYPATMLLVDSKVAAETPKEVLSAKIIIFCAVLSFSGALHGKLLLYPDERKGSGRPSKE